MDRRLGPRGRRAETGSSSVQQLMLAGLLAASVAVVAAEDGALLEGTRVAACRIGMAFDPSLTCGEGGTGGDHDRAGSNLPTQDEFAAPQAQRPRFGEKPAAAPASRNEPAVGLVDGEILAISESGPMEVAGPDVVQEGIVTIHEAIDLAPSEPEVSSVSHVDRLSQQITAKGGADVKVVEAFALPVVPWILTGLTAFAIWWNQSPSPVGDGSGDDPQESTTLGSSVVIDRRTPKPLESRIGGVHLWREDSDKFKLQRPGLSSLAHSLELRDGELLYKLPPSGNPHDPSGWLVVGTKVAETLRVHFELAELVAQFSVEDDIDGFYRGLRGLIPGGEDARDIKTQSTPIIERQDRDASVHRDDREQIRKIVWKDGGIGDWSDHIRTDESFDEMENREDFLPTIFTDALPQVDYWNWTVSAHGLPGAPTVGGGDGGVPVELEPREDFVAAHSPSDSQWDYGPRAYYHNPKHSWDVGSVTQHVFGHPGFQEQLVVNVPTVPELLRGAEGAANLALLAELEMRMFHDRGERTDGGQAQEDKSQNLFAEWLRGPAGQAKLAEVLRGQLDPRTLEWIEVDGDASIAMTTVPLTNARAGQEGAHWNQDAYEYFSPWERALQPLRRAKLLYGNDEAARMLAKGMRLSQIDVIVAPALNSYSDAFAMVIALGLEKYREGSVDRDGHPIDPLYYARTGPHVFMEGFSLSHPDYIAGPLPSWSRYLEAEKIAKELRIEDEFRRAAQVGLREFLSDEHNVRIDKNFRMYERMVDVLSDGKDITAHELWRQVRRRLISDGVRSEELPEHFAPMATHMSGGWVRTPDASLPEPFRLTIETTAGDTWKFSTFADGERDGTLRMSFTKVYPVTPSGAPDVSASPTEPGVRELVASVGVRNLLRSVRQRSPGVHTLELNWGGAEGSDKGPLAKKKIVVDVATGAVVTTPIGPGGLPDLVGRESAFARPRSVEAPLGIEGTVVLADGIYRQTRRLYDRQLGWRYETRFLAEGRQWLSEEAARDGPEAEQRARAMQAVAPRLWGLPIHHATESRWNELISSGTEDERAAFVAALATNAATLRDLSVGVAATTDVPTLVTQVLLTNESSDADSHVIGLTYEQEAERAVRAQFAIERERARQGRVLDTVGQTHDVATARGALSDVVSVDVQPIVERMGQAPSRPRGRPAASTDATFLQLLHERLPVAQLSDPMPLLTDAEYRERLSAKRAVDLFGEGGVDRLKAMSPTTPLFVSRWPKNLSNYAVPGLLHASDVVWLLSDPSLAKVDVEGIARVDREAILSIMQNDERAPNSPIPFEEFEILQTWRSEDRYGGGGNYHRIHHARRGSREYFIKVPKKQTNLVASANAARGASALNAPDAQIYPYFAATTTTPDGEAIVLGWLEAAGTETSARDPAVLADDVERAMRRTWAAGLEHRTPVRNGLEVVGSDGMTRWLLVDTDSLVIGSGRPRLIAREEFRSMERDYRGEATRSP